MDRETEAAAINALQDRIGARHEPKIRAAIREAMLEAARDVPLRGRVEIPVDHFRRIEDAMRALYRDITRATAAAMVDRFKSGFSWIETKEDESGFYERLLDQYLRDYGGEKISAISATTRRQIMDTVARGLRDGLSLPEIALDIEDRAPLLAGVRAAVIARTETHSASMFASMQTAKRSTIPLDKEWVSVEDGRTRDDGAGDGEIDEFDHRVMNGVRVPIDDPFEVPHKSGMTESLMFPGDPKGSAANIINCRCSQVYEEADEPRDVSPADRAQGVPAGDARARLLDKIAGRQQIFAQNYDGSLDDAQEISLRAILAAGDLSPMIYDPKNGAYADFKGSISMGKHIPGTEGYKRVFRHEYGHFLDLRIAEDIRRRTGTGAGRFASWSAVDDLVADGKELEAGRSIVFQTDTSTAQKTAAANLGPYVERVDELVRSSPDNADAILRRIIPEVEPDDVWRLYDATSRTPIVAARIAAAWERRDVGQALADAPLRAGSARITHASGFAGLQDTVEASTGAALSMQFGHGKNYYSKTNKWTRAVGLAKTFGRRRFNAYATGQAFANWFEAFNDQNPATYALYRRLFPRTSATFEAMVEEFVSNAAT